jgi:hypothetical protein
MSRPGNTGAGDSPTRLPSPRLRIRLRTPLIAAAVADTASGGRGTWRRRESCLARAAAHASLSGRRRSEADQLDRRGANLREAVGRLQAWDSPPDGGETQALFTRFGATAEGGARGALALR